MRKLAMFVFCAVAFNVGAASADTAGHEPACVDSPDDASRARCENYYATHSEQQIVQQRKDSAQFLCKANIVQACKMSALMDEREKLAAAKTDSERRAAAHEINKLLCDLRDNSACVALSKD